MAIKSVTLDGKLFDINYEIINPKNEQTIVFLHGWGSNKEVMKTAFDDVFKDFRHFYIDMPGFGKSTNSYVLTTKDYCEIMVDFFDSLDLKTDDLIIAGHSFGGKVATFLKPSHLILLSSAGILEEKSKKVKIKIALAKIANKLGVSYFSKLFRSKDVETMSENMYGTFKNVVDEDFSGEFKIYQGKTTIFWGKEDTATSLQSGKTIHQLIKNSQFYDFDGGHYFFLKHSKEIEDKIKQQFDGR